jgi:hypothetical protein
MKPGIFNDITIEDYHSQKDWFSASGLKMAKKSLKLFRLFLDGYFDEDVKSHFMFGNAFELALLDPDSFNNKVAVEDEIINQILISNPDVKSPRSTNQYKEWYEEQIAKQKYIIKYDGKESFRVIEEMLKSCLSDAVIQRLIKGIEYNYSLCWIDENGLQLKTRPDICKVKKNIIVNLKTTTDGSPEKFSKDLANYDYPFQACMEIDGALSSGFMDKVDNYYWLVVEKEPPFSATLYEFMPDDIAWCFDEYTYTKKIVKEAMDKNLWPSYSQRASNPYGIIEAKIPMYYRNYGL